MTDAARTNEPQESDLLVPFEIQNIPDKYREYYRIRRHNFFASIQGFSEMWRYYHRLDSICLRELHDLEVAGNASRVFPLVLYTNAHAKIRIAVELGFSGCMAEGRSILRDAVEHVAHAHHMLKDPLLQNVWLDKVDNDEAFKDAFERNKKRGLFNGLEELHKQWGELCELGSHATPLALSERFVITTTPEGYHWTVNYTGLEERLWAMSLFNMLLTCFVMENTFFNDYKSRLQLDNVLVKIRSEFEKYKEHLRRTVIERYRVPPPRQPLIHVP